MQPFKKGSTSIIRKLNHDKKGSKIMIKKWLSFEDEPLYIYRDEDLLGNSDKMQWFKNIY